MFYGIDVNLLVYANYMYSLFIGRDTMLKKEHFDEVKGFVSVTVCTVVEGVIIVLVGLTGFIVCSIPILMVMFILHLLGIG